MADRLYVDVSAVRIQHYLARTSPLKGRRGASAAIIEATRLTDESPLLRGRARINPEAGEADGVVNLLVDLPDPGDRGGPASTSAGAEAEELARRVLAHLRGKLPGAEFQAVWGVGESYLDVHHDTIGPRRARGEVLADLPPAREFPYAVGCRICHHDPATGRVSLGKGEERDACADCEVRYSWPVRAAGEGHERRLSEAVGAERTAQTLSELAKLGDRGSGRNHIATVFIDGNAFGDFFDHLASHRNRIDNDTKTLVSQSLNEHTFEALVIATLAVSEDSDDGMLCAVPHLIGGDDVLVSLPADRAWAFTRHYLREFGRLAEQTRKQVEVPGLPRLSASAGLVFAHHTYPFHLVVEEAEARLRAAKAHVGGGQASVDFTNITKDGPDSSHPVPLTVGVLDAEEAHLDAFARLPASLRANLAEQSAQGTEKERGARVQNTVDRLGQRRTVAPFLTDAKSGAEPAIELEQALRIAKWWR